MKTLKSILGICEHNWIEKDVIDVYDVNYGNETPHYHKFILKCEKCGDIKIIKT